MSKTDKTDDQQVVAPIRRSGSAVAKAGNAGRDAADKNGSAAREAAESGSDITRDVAAMGREAADKSRDVARDVAEKGHEVARDVVKQKASAVEQTTERSVAAFAAAADHAGIWRELATAQMAHNVETFQKLAAARNWPEQLAIQQGYLQGNVERFVEATSCCMALTDSMLGQQQQRRGSVAERPARA